MTARLSTVIEILAETNGKFLPRGLPSHIIFVFGFSAILGTIRIRVRIRIRVFVILYECILALVIYFRLAQKS